MVLECNLLEDTGLKAFMCSVNVPEIPLVSSDTAICILTCLVLKGAVQSWLRCIAQTSHYTRSCRTLRMHRSALTGSFGKTVIFTPLIRFSGISCITLVSYSHIVNFRKCENRNSDLYQESVFFECICHF